MANYAEWIGTNVRSTARNCAYVGDPSRSVRHSPAGGINREAQRD
jgi:hypothetical protein